MDYTLIRSQRRTVSLAVTPEGVVVRAPLRMARADIDRFVESNRPWIDAQKAKLAAREAALSAVAPLSPEELEALAQSACRVIPERAAHYAALLGVRFGRVTIRAQRTRWGSCSAKGNLNFNCLLMLAPPEVLDSVVVHELCHLKELNHSPRFYALVHGVFPDYDRCHQWLRENGESLLRRLG